MRVRRSRNPAHPRDRAARARWRPGAVLAGVGLLLAGACAPSPPAAPRSVLLITIDTLRADHLHAYGHPEPLTPAMDALGRRGIVFTRAVAASSATAPSHASLFTSRHARHHSIGTGNGTTRLVGTPTLARMLADAGYQTAAFVGNAVLSEEIGLDAGFGVYDDELRRPRVTRPRYATRRPRRTTEKAVAWLEGAAEPFLLWVHYQDPHGPYTPPERFLESLPDPEGVASKLRVLHGPVGPRGIPDYQALPGLRSAAAYRSRYAGEVSYADFWIGRLLEALRRKVPDGRRIVLLTADHGESLGENDFFFQHGHATTPAVSHVPLILRAPGLAPARRDQLVHHVDVLPTLLELTGVDGPDDLAGESLLPLAESGDGAYDPGRVVFCDIEGTVGAYRDDELLRYRANFVPIRAGAVRATAHRWLPDGRLAPAPLPRDLLEAARAYVESEVDPVPIDGLESDQRRRLRALGYLTSDDAAPGPDGP